MIGLLVNFDRVLVGENVTFRVLYFPTISQMVITPKLESFKKSNGTHRIYIYLYDAETRTKAKISTSHYCSLKDWAGSKMKDGIPNAGFVNADLARIVSALTNYHLRHQDLLPVELKAWHEGDKEVIYDPVSYFKHYIDQCKSGDVTKKHTKQRMTQGYIKALHTAYVQFKEFGCVSWNRLDENHIDKYVKWLRDKGFKQNTIKKYVVYLVVISNHAIKKGLRTGDRLEYYVAKEKVFKIRLTPEEVEMISNVDLSDYPELEPEQDRFQVAYNLLLRYSDSVSLTEKNIVTKGKKHFANIVTQKTRQEVQIPLQDKVYRILKKYGFRMPERSNTKSNRDLKKIAMYAGVHELVTLTTFKDGVKTEIRKRKYELMETHTTRRSAARNLFDAGLEPEVIMRLGGWSTMKQLLEYIDIDLDYAATKAAGHDFFK